MNSAEGKEKLSKKTDYGVRNKFFSIPFEIRSALMILLTTLAAIPVLRITTETVHSIGAYIAIIIFVIMNVITVLQTIYENTLLKREIKVSEAETNNTAEQ